MYPPLPCAPVPLYPATPRNQVHCTLETIYHVPQARIHVPSNLDTMYFYQKFDKKLG